jgi:hypothetical protein
MQALLQRRIILLLFNLADWEKFFYIGHRFFGKIHYRTLFELVTE